MHFYWARVRWIEISKGNGEDAGVVDGEVGEGDVEVFFLLLLWSPVVPVGLSSVAGCLDAVTGFGIRA